MKKYWETIKVYKEASKAFDKCYKCQSSLTFLDSCFFQCHNRYYELSARKENDFITWTDVNQSILRCSFLDLIDHKDPAYYIQLCDWKMDPYEIPISDNDPEGILDYWGDEDPDISDEDPDA